MLNILRLQQHDVSLCQVGELAEKPAREQRKLAFRAGRTKLFKVGVINGDTWPGRMTDDFLVVLAAERSQSSQILTR